MRFILLSMASLLTAVPGFAMEPTNASSIAVPGVEPVAVVSGRAQPRTNPCTPVSSS